MLHRIESFRLTTDPLQDQTLSSSLDSVTSLARPAPAIAVSYGVASGRLYTSRHLQGTLNFEVSDEP